MKSILVFFSLFVGLIAGAFVIDANAQLRTNDVKGQCAGLRTTPGPNLVDVAIAINNEGPYAGQFDTLIAAVGAADALVVDTLTGRGQFTVFAPTDDAFQAIGLNPGNIDTVDEGFLTQVLLYHVARGRRDASQVTTSDRIRSLQGSFFFPNNSATITDALGRTADIFVTDVPASNGIIHAIDAVLLPFAPPQ